MAGGSLHCAVLLLWTRCAATFPPPWAPATGGLASTLFWVDPAEELIVLFFTQLIPSSTFNFCGQFEALVYAALD